MATGAAAHPELESYQFAAKSVLQPPAAQAVIAKYETLTHRIIATDRQQDIEDAVLTLDQAPDLTRLASLLAAPVTSPFEASFEDSVC